MTFVLCEQTGGHAKGDIWAKTEERTFLNLKGLHLQHHRHKQKTVHLVFTKLFANEIRESQRSYNQLPQLHCWEDSHKSNSTNENV